MKRLPLYAHEPAPCSNVEQGPAQPLLGGCTLCELGPVSHSKGLRAALTGPETGPTLYVLGISPTQEEDRKGVPFTSSAGLYVRGLLSDWPGPVVFDNVLRCPQPRDKTTPAKTKKQIAACLPYGRQVLRDVQPSRVLLLGGLAMSAFLGHGYMPLSVRKGYTSLDNGAPVFLLQAPLGAMRNRIHRAWFEEDLKWALTADPEPPPLGAVTHLLETPEDVAEAVRVLEQAPWITWDAETYGAPGNREFTILDIAFCAGGSDTVFSIRRELLESHGAPLLDLLERKPHGGFNIKFDQTAVRFKFGRKLRASFDAMSERRYHESSVLLELESAQAAAGMLGAKSALAFEAATRGQLTKYAKKPKPHADWWFSSTDPAQNLAELEFAVDRIVEDDDAHRYSYAGIPPERRSTYNALDTLSTDRIHYNYLVRAAENEEAARAQRVWDKVGSGMHYALSCIEYNGIHADKAKIRELIKFCDDDIREVEESIEKEQGRKLNFHAGSPDTAWLMFDKLGLNCKRFTPSQRRQTSEDVLKELADNTSNAYVKSVVERVIKWRKRSHFKAQYAEGMLRYIRDDGLIHPNMRDVGTETGRPSGNDPNLLNLPRLDAADGSGKLCRDIFITPDGWEFLEGDQSQIELRVAAFLSGDMKMIEAYKAGLDVHLEAAIITAPYVKVDPDEVRALGKKHPHRSNTKSIVFGALYGEPAASQAKKLGITKQQAEKLQKLIFGHYSRLAAWCQEQLQFARRHGYCYTWWDGEKFRRRLLSDITSQEEPVRLTAERSGWNTPIQGTAADYTNATLGAMQEWIDRRWPTGEPEAALCLTVYDSILLRVRPHVKREVALELKRLGESWPTLHGMPLELELSHGTRFGSLEKYRP